MSDFKVALLKEATAEKRDESFVDIVIKLLAEVEITEVEHFYGDFESYSFQSSMSGAKKSFIKKLFGKFAKKLMPLP